MSLRDEFRDAQLPTRTVPLPANRSAWEAAHAELEEATAALQHTRRGGQSPPELVEREAAAQAAVNGLKVYRWLVCTLEADEYEALVSQHPALPDADHGWPFHPPAFHPALLAATVSLHGKSDDAEWWAAPKGLGPAVKQHLLNVAMSLNGHVSIVSEAVGKGSPQTPS